MTEYNRFVSYMYVYENNQKTMNNGFVRVETRGNQCFIYIHMKDLYGNQKSMFKVYMVRRYRDKLAGVYLGDLSRKDSQGEFNYKTQRDNIENSGIPLMDMAGIVVIGEQGRKYGTCWDEEVLDMHSFTDKSLPTPAKPAERVKTVVYQKQIEEVKPIIKVEETMPAVAPALQTSDLEEMPQIIEMDLTPQLQPAAAECAEEFPQDNVSFTQAAFTAVPEVLRHSAKKLTLEERLDKILDKGEKMYPFEDDDVERCVRMELQDIGMMPMKFWSYVSNSFLLHSYYSYRHLILGQKKNGEYILGVPGMGQKKDRFMAQMFGFSAFKCIRDDERGKSDFGYWYIILK